MVDLAGRWRVDIYTEGLIRGWYAAGCGDQVTGNGRKTQQKAAVQAGNGRF